MSSLIDSPVLERIAAPAFDGLTPQAARAILRVKLKPADVRRIRALAELGQKRTLSDAEQGELDLYLQIGHMLTLMHSKARVTLKSGDARKRRKTA